MKDLLGNSNPMKTEYVADLIEEVARRMESPQYDDECNPVKRHPGDIDDRRKRKTRRLKRA